MSQSESEAAFDPDEASFELRRRQVRPKVFRLYADGSSSGKSDKPGGYGWVLLYEDGDALVEVGSGSDPKTSNNKMELSAIIQGLLRVKELATGTGADGMVYVPLTMGRRLIKVISDSQYALNTLGGNFQPNTNHDLIRQGQQVMAELEKLGVELDLMWVKGHSGEQWQERADWLATSAKEKLKAELGYGKLYQGHGLPPKELKLKF